MKILLVAGARPNFMKIAPLIHALKSDGRGMSWKVVHTGQHYDYDMSRVFFEELDIPKPDYFLSAGSGSHAEQSAKIMVEFDKVCAGENPDLVVVVGDVNSTLACSITAKKLGVKVAHVEAGLRSGDMSMPEEINRIVTDSISDYLFVSEKSGMENLKREGKNEKQLYFVGNIMIDSLFYCLNKLGDRKSEQSINGNYAVVTLHRPSNVDNREKLKNILSALSEISNDMSIFFPVHPRTEKAIEKFHLGYLLESSNIKVMSPMPYMEFTALWKDALLILTDSGGIQEESTVLGVPCFTIRENTERPVTIEEGTNTLVGTTYGGILRAYKNFKINKNQHNKIPELWDGRTAERIIALLSKTD